MKQRRSSFGTVIAVAIALWAGIARGSELATGSVHSVIELTFTGPIMSSADNPVLAVDFWVLFRHESGSPEYKVHGFWDADGGAGTTGNVWRVRFCPTAPGRWNLMDAHSNRAELDNQHEGDWVTATASALRGFWLADPASAQARWFRRSDGSHQYLVGNTHYDFLARPAGLEATPATIAADIHANADFFKKLRFCVMSPRSENTSTIRRPFFDANGNMTAQETDVPDPRFFRERVDVAVRTGFDRDLVCDLILGGTGSDQVADKEGYLKYVAARYGSYPNVWFCIGQEYDEQSSAAFQRGIGAMLRSYLAYPSPVSTHGLSGWNSALNGAWASHSIRQGKIYDLAPAAGAMETDYANNGGKPTVNDENGYDPNEASTPDVVEGVTGTFLGGGYGTTGHKTGSKLGGYYWGHAARGRTITEHPSIESLRFLRESIDAQVTFWRLAPVALSASIFSNAAASYRAMQWPGNEHILGTDAAHTGVGANLPEGTWRVTRFDIVARTATTLSTSATGFFTFDAPASRSVLFHFKRTSGDPDNQPPTVFLSAAPTTVLVHTPLAFTVLANDPDGAITSHVWNWGDATETVSGAPPAGKTRAWAAPGQYHVTLTVTDNGTPPASTTSSPVAITVTTNPPPVVATARATPDNGYLPLFVAFAASASDPHGDPLTYSWDFDGNGSTDATGATATYTYTALGYYNPVLRVSDGENTVFHPLTVEVAPVPASGTSVTTDFSPEADTYVSETSPGTSYGTATEMAVGGGSTRREAFLRFNVTGLPAGASVTDAKLLLRCSNSSIEVGGGGTIRKFAPIDEQWPETTATWNNPITGAVASGDLATLGPVSGGLHYEFTGLESAVTGNGRVTFVLRSNTQDGCAYRTREFGTAGHRPVLRITSRVHDPFAEWQTARFTADQRANPAISGPDADPDGDGMVNLMEYALKLDPWAADAAGVLLAGLRDDHLSLNYVKDKTATDVSYSVEVSDNLVTGWTTNGISQQIVSDDGILQIIKATDPATVSGNPVRFIRLRVEQEP